ncbi:MAG: alpha/beta fold hydrolase [Cyanobacteria bacterium HKST-UBA02]|nr:alpha/beta fold hydrolase [Cyanobacteria bacterium HKST-UBA02]
MDHPEYSPPLALANPHLMTIAAAAWPRLLRSVVARESRRIINVTEQDRVVVALNRAGAERSRSLAILVHGLEGDSRSHYMLGLSGKLIEAGIDTARLNLRNCGGTAHLCRTLYNAGMSEDLVVVASTLMAEEGYERIYFHGLSLGGNIVLKAASELGDTGWLRGVCAVSPSIDLAASVEALGTGANRIYDLNFVIALKRKLRKKARLFPELFDPGKLSLVTTVRDFDETYTAPDGGYDSAEHYYRSASALPRMASVKAPVLIITAKDDPLVPYRSFAAPVLDRPNIKVIATAAGGHGGFLLGRGEGQPRDKRLKADRFWAEDQACRFFVNLDLD